MESGRGTLRFQPRQVLRERRDQGVATLAVDVACTGDMPVVIAAGDQLCKGQLLDRRRTGILGSLCGTISSTISSGRLIQPSRMPGASVLDAVPMWITRHGSSPWIAPIPLRS